jgi:hypothetical protein
MQSLLDTFDDNYRLNPRTPVGEDGFKFSVQGQDATPIESTPYASKQADESQICGKN